MKLFNMPDVRMEMIKFQDKDKFGPAAEELVEAIYAKCEKGYIDLEVQKLPEIAKLEKLIFERFGINNKINTEGTLAAVIPFYLNQNSIFLHKVNRGDKILVEQEELRVDGKSGWVDLDTAKLGGVFSEHITTVYMSFTSLFRSNITKRGVVGILLHELGHYFYGCYFTSRLDRGNQIVNEALRKGAKAGDKDKMTVFFSEVQKTTKSLDQNLLNALTSDNPVVFGRAALALTNEVCMSQLNNSLYDNTSFEMLADNFSTRMGYGIDTLEGLQKITGGVAGEYFMGMAASFMKIIEISNRMTEAIFYLKYGSLIPFVRYLQIFKTMAVAFLSIYVLVITSGETGKEYTYDDLSKRYNRIRNQLIEQIKQKAYTKADTVILINNISAIGLMLKDARSYVGPIDFLFNSFNPRDRNAVASVKRQQAIEDLFSNELFVKSIEMNIAY